MSALHVFLFMLPLVCGAALGIVLALGHLDRREADIHAAQRRRWAGFRWKGRSS